VRYPLRQSQDRGKGDVSALPLWIDVMPVGWRLSDEETRRSALREIETKGLKSADSLRRALRAEVAPVASANGNASRLQVQMKTATTTIFKDAGSFFKTKEKEKKTMAL